jgi:hypothetical protein
VSLPHLRKFISHNKIPVLVLVAAMAALLWFTAALIRNFIYFHDPRHQDEVLKPWMTPRYIAMSYDLPRSVVMEVLQSTKDVGGPRRLGDLAQDQRLTLADLESRVREAAAAYRAAQE